MSLTCTNCGNDGSFLAKAYTSVTVIVNNDKEVINARAFDQILEDFSDIEIIRCSRCGCIEVEDK